MNAEHLMNQAIDFGIVAGGKLLGALVLWIVGRWLIGFVGRMIKKVMTSRALDQTIATYAVSGVKALLNVALVVALLGYFGFETTTFAALLAAVGVAIGMAWSGLLAHFAAGVFMVVLRPFKVGDFVSAGGVTGTVVEIGLFVTHINTLDNVCTLVANNKVFSENIQNFTANQFRRVDLRAQIDHTVDPEVASASLKRELQKISNIAQNMPATVDILEFNLAGTVLAVRVHCRNSDYWQVYFDGNRTIHQVCSEGNFATPKTHHRVAQVS